jgi:hypothetical protein
VYGWDTRVLLRHLLTEGLSRTATARRLGAGWGAVYHWLAPGQLERA